MQNTRTSLKETRVDKLSVWFLLLVFFIYMVVPKSLSYHVPGNFGEFSVYLGPWYIQRYFLAGICIVYVLLQIGRGFVKVTLLSTILFFLMMAFAFIQLTSGQYAVFYAPVGAITAYVLVKSNDFMEIPRLGRCLVILFCLVYVSQYAFYRVGGRVTGTFLDPNISGYYLFLCYCIFRFSGMKIFALMALVAGFLSWSRNFYLAVFLFELVNLRFVKTFLRDRLSIFNPFFLSVLSLVLVVFVSYVFVSIGDYNQTIGNSADRIVNIKDESNYNRAKGNLDVISRVIDGDFILYGNGSQIDDKTDLRPHNAFLRAIYRYGLPLSVLSFFCFFYVCKRLAWDAYPSYIALFAYYSILNDFITGADLVLLACFYYLCACFLRIKSKKSNNEYVYRFLSKISS